MKKLFIISILLCGSFASPAQTPTWDEWFKQKKTQRRYLRKQIVLLRVYLEYLKEGYDIAQKGLTTIGDIKDGTFRLDIDYFNSLKQINQVVTSSPKVKDILSLQQNILRSLRFFHDQCRQDENLTPQEVDYIATVCNNMMIECQASLDELTLITQAGEVEMKDDERLLRLDKIHEDMIEKYAFTQDFISGTKLLSLERAKAKRQALELKNLYDQS